MNPYEVREEATRLIGEDRVPTEVLAEIVDQYGQHTSGEATVLMVAQMFARSYGVDVRLIEEDHNGPPMDTTDYEGRALAFIFEVDGYAIRVVVEDVTIDGERRSTIYQAIE